MTVARCITRFTIMLAIWLMPSITDARANQRQSTLQGVDPQLIQHKILDLDEANGDALTSQETTGSQTSSAMRFEVVFFTIVALIILLFVLLRPPSTTRAGSPPHPDAAVTPQATTQERETEEQLHAAESLEPPPDMSDGVAVELALQTWRLEKRIKQLPLAEHPKLLRRMEDSVKKLAQLLTDNQVVIDDPLHRKYVEGWVEVEAVAAETVTADEYPAGLDEGPFVHETRRPIVRRNNRPIAKGEVVIAGK